ncbi:MULTISPECIES: hypothetical protein [Helicobacter]|uniref:hypothetical protein n=1 Tax=Helicobacter TaxID=209 RepID=UPI002FE0DE36
MKLFWIIFVKICILGIPIYFGVFQNKIQNIFENNKLLDLINLVLLAVLLITLIVEAYNQYKIIKYKKLSKLVNAYRSFISGYFDDELKLISNTLNYTESERLTLFLYSSSQNAFYSVGRYSKSPKYNQIGRYIIDNPKEYVFAVINEENHRNNPQPIKHKWFNLFRYKVKMLSNDMYGVYIENKGIKIGVVIAQTMKQNKFNNKNERKKLKEEVIKLQEKIIQMKINPNVLPSEIDLTEKGL